MKLACDNLNHSDPIKLYSIHPETEVKTLALVIPNLVEHPLFLQSDVEYFKRLGLSVFDIENLWNHELGRFEKVSEKDVERYVNY